MEPNSNQTIRVDSMNYTRWIFITVWKGYTSRSTPGYTTITPLIAVYKRYSYVITYLSTLVPLTVESSSWHKYIYISILQCFANCLDFSISKTFSFPISFAASRLLRVFFTSLSRPSSRRDEWNRGDKDQYDSTSIRFLIRVYLPKLFHPLYTLC